MTARYFCMYCGEGIIAPAYSNQLECKNCGHCMDLPPSSMNGNSSHLSAPDTPSCASSVSSRSNSVESRSSAEARSPPPGSTVLSELNLESDSNSDDDMDDHLASGATGPLKKRRRSSGKRRDPRAPKRAANAYMLFCKYQRPLLKLSNPDLPFAIIGQTLGDMWRNLPNEARKPFEDRAAHDRERYKYEMTAYTASTLRMGPPMNQLLTQSMNHSMNQSMNPAMMSHEMLNAMAQEYQLQAAQNQWNNNESMAGQWGNETSPSGNPSMKQQVPLMVQQAQERFLQMQQQGQQPRQRFHPYEQSLNQSMNQQFNQSNNQSFDYPENRSFKAEPIKSNNNQFVYGPIKRERRLSNQNENYQTATNNFSSSMNNSAKSPISLNESSFNQFTQTNSRQPASFDNFSQFESQYRSQLNQLDFSSASTGPASSLACSGSALASNGSALSSGTALSSLDYFNLDAPQLWESTFDEL